MKCFDRCEMCGSWDTQCISDEPVQGCGCTRCASHTIIKLERELAEMTEQRDAAFEMSKCQCGTDEACSNLARLHRERDEARAEAQALRKDAERYRWLRMAAIADEDDLIERLAAIDSQPETEAAFDAAIDAARLK